VVPGHPSHPFQNCMAIGLEESYDTNLGSYGAVVTANTAEDQEVPDYIAVSGETQPASAEQGDNRWALHKILLCQPSYQTPPQHYSRQMQQTTIFCLWNVILLGFSLSDSRLAVPVPLCGVEGTVPDAPSNPSMREGIVGESGFQVRRARNQACVLSEENGLASAPYLLIVISPVASVVAPNLAVVNDPASNQVDVEAGCGRTTRVGRDPDWENAHACSRTPTPDDAYAYSPPGYQRVCARASACEAKVERACGVSSRAARMSSLRLGGDCGRSPAWTSCGNRGWARHFDSSGVSLTMVSAGCFVLACQSLACPAAPGLCCVPAPPPSNPSAEIVKPSVCGPGCVRAASRGRGRPAS
jgi:hypothetical protein